MVKSLMLKIFLLLFFKDVPPPGFEDVSPPPSKDCPPPNKSTPADAPISLKVSSASVMVKIVKETYMYTRKRNIVDDNIPSFHLPT